MTPEDIRALSEARGRQITPPAPKPTTPEQQPFYDDPYLAYGRAKYGTIEGTISGTPISGVTGGGTNTGGDDNTGGDEEEQFVPTAGAKAILRNVLASYGLESLYEYAYSLYAKDEIDVNDGDSLIFALKEQEAYKKRFAANERRKSLGFKELSPATYIAMEKAYKDTLAANGLPQGFYDSPDDFEKLIGGDVSTAELNNRLRDAYRVVQDASPEVKNKMAEMYGITDGDLLAYVIDPDRARLLMAPDYKRQAQAALIAESAQRLSGLNFNKDVAEQFVRQGVTQAEAESAFTTVGQMGELRRGGFGEQQISDLQFAQAALGTDAEAKRLVEERKKRRIGEVTASGGSATLAQGDSGSYRSGYGQANL
ncbi:hypothetical protein uvFWCGRAMDCOMC493_045 [Freshwater phage uvFW-CGR-AMD-COM-C493]|nr:hypothetical protein uvFWCGRAMDCOMC493_045 [Freshwater phage uvFW-CGR-AMD-COM-C493]